MKNFFIGFVIGIVFAGLVLLILGFAAVRMAATLGNERQASVPDTAALVLNLEGAVPEQAPVDVAIPFLQQQTRSPCSIPGSCSAGPPAIRASRRWCWSRGASTRAGPSSKSCARRSWSSRNPASPSTLILRNAGTPRILPGHRRRQNLHGARG